MPSYSTVPVSLSSPPLLYPHLHREWEAAREKGDDFRYCARNFLSPATMNMLDGMRRQLLGELQNRSLVRSLAEASAHMSDIGKATCR